MCVPRQYMCAQLCAFPNTLADAAGDLQEPDAVQDIRGRACGSGVGALEGPSVIDELRGVRQRHIINFRPGWELHHLLRSACYCEA